MSKVYCVNCRFSAWDRSSNCNHPENFVRNQIGHKNRVAKAADINKNYDCKWYKDSLVTKLFRKGWIVRCVTLLAICAGVVGLFIGLSML